MSVEEIELKKTLKADCTVCRTEKADFNYLGLNTPLFTDKLINRFGLDFLVDHYTTSLFLYGCSKCSSSRTLSSLTPIEDKQ